MGSILFNMEVSLLMFLVIILAAGVIYVGIKGFMKAPDICIDEREEKIAKIVCSIIIGIGVIGLLFSKSIARGLVSSSNEKTETSFEKLLEGDWE